MNVVEVLDNIMRERKGNRPRAEQWQIVQVLLEIEREQPVGRLKLMEKVGMSEATVKTVVRRLREAGLVEVDRVGGVLLNERGRSVVDIWKARFEIADVELRTIGWVGNLLRVVGGTELLSKTSVVELRDLGVKSGATAVLVAVFRDGKVELPPMTVEEVEPLLREVRDSCPRCSDGDVAFITTPRTPQVPYNLSIWLQRIMQ
ncbi:helix-turn-helix domain-containing protein [Sulfodiicoccus acidiphilus]|nr:helix-turn-helix domain-containing protein [Sulfodiicoccus acidiphilus]